MGAGHRGGEGMSTSTYRLDLKEAATKSLILEGSGQKVCWLVALIHEVQQGRARYVGTVYSATNNRPVGVGKRGEKRRVMESREEAYEWYERVAS
jgi:hypothetical protein